MKTNNIFGLRLLKTACLSGQQVRYRGGEKGGEDGESKRKKNNVKEKYLSPCSLVSMLAKKEKGVFIFSQSVPPVRFL